jgi:phosphatidylethanolamine/phosphatidyl-N-methylethanolamine N-methyltransferase
MTAGAGVFLGLWFQKPLQIAAVCPSGEKLATVIARHADLDRPGFVLELGAGTGSLTAGLLRAGCPPERLVALECEPRLVAVLRNKFRGIQAIVGDATELDDHLRKRGVERLAVVVSSLPIKWFPVEAQRAVTQPCFERLGPGGRFLQITNAFSSPLARHRLGIDGWETARVWRNLPPVQIWTYTTPGCDLAQGMP